MRSDGLRLYLLVTAFSIAMLYGSSYQQFRFFTLEDPGGAADAVFYVAMARGSITETVVFYQDRWITPDLAAAADRLVHRAVADPDLSIRWSFYVVNFAMSLTSCVVLFALLRTMGYSVLLSLLGLGAFAASRITVMATATPLVDAIYFCAVAIIVWLTVARRTLALALLLPLLVLTKETILPFVALPLLTDLRKSRSLWAGIAAGALTFFISRQNLSGALLSGTDTSLIPVVVDHLGLVGQHLRQLFTLRGIHDLQNGFSLLLPMAAAGAWLNRRHHLHAIPFEVAATIPIAFGLALLSGNLGRMFFAAFPAVIAYALVAVEYVTTSTAVQPAQAGHKLVTEMERRQQLQ